jgi:hypothetical protein
MNFFISRRRKSDKKLVGSDPHWKIMRQNKVAIDRTKILVKAHTAIITEGNMRAKEGLGKAFKGLALYIPAGSRLF